MDLIRDDEALEDVMKDADRARALYEEFVVRPSGRGDSLLQLRDKLPEEVFDEVCTKNLLDGDKSKLADGVLNGFKKHREFTTKHLKKQPRDIGRVRNKPYHVLALAGLTRELNKHPRCEWTESEVNKLTDAINRFKGKHKGYFTFWTYYSQYILNGSKTPEQCMRYFKDHMMFTKKGEWSEEETRQLIDAICKFGVGKWRDVCLELRGKGINRNNICCNDKWRKISRNVAKREGIAISEVTPLRVKALLAVAENK